MTATVLHLVPARQEWPELESTTSSRRSPTGRGATARPGPAAHTVSAALAAAGAALGVALVVAAAGRAGLDRRDADHPRGRREPHRRRASWPPGPTASRSPAPPWRAYSLPYAFVAGALLVATRRPGGPGARPAPGSARRNCWSARRRWCCTACSASSESVPAAGCSRPRADRGLLGAPARRDRLRDSPPQGAAAILLAVLVCGVGLLPLLAIRLARLPMPPVTRRRPAAQPGPARPRTGRRGRPRADENSLGWPADRPRCPRGGRGRRARGDRRRMGSGTGRRSAASRCCCGPGSSGPSANASRCWPPAPRRSPPSPWP